jgi:hypothetical protein
MSCCTSQTVAPRAQTGAFTTNYHGKPVRMTYGGRELLAGFHITEVKRMKVEAMDCGANRDGWTETVIQLLDIDGPDSSRMTADRFEKIIRQTGNSLSEGKVIIEVGRPGEAMQLFDVIGFSEAEDHVILAVNPRQAVCKPAFKLLNLPQNACCGTEKAAGASCCG